MQISINATTNYAYKANKFINESTKPLANAEKIENSEVINFKGKFISKSANKIKNSVLATALAAMVGVGFTSCDNGSKYTYYETEQDSNYTNDDTYYTDDIKESSNNSSANKTPEQYDFIQDKFLSNDDPEPISFNLLVGANKVVFDERGNAFNSAGDPLHPIENGYVYITNNSRTVVYYNSSGYAKNVHWYDENGRLLIEAFLNEDGTLRSYTKLKCVGEDCAAVVYDVFGKPMFIL